MSPREQTSEHPADGDAQLDVEMRNPLARPPVAAASEPPTRRTVITQGTKLLAYSAPLIQLFRPTQALAASGLSPTS